MDCILSSVYDDFLTTYHAYSTGEIPVYSPSDQCASDIYPQFFPMWRVI